MTQVITEQGDLGLGVMDFPDVTLNEAVKEKENKDKEKEDKK